jgi:capsule polysaccharide export protein KpsE/RkpR
MEYVRSQIIDLFSKPASYDIAYQPERLHNMFCECGSKRCFGYTSLRWAKVLQ